MQSLSSLKNGIVELEEKLQERIEKGEEKMFKNFLQCLVILMKGTGKMSL